MPRRGGEREEEWGTCGCRRAALRYIIFGRELGRAKPPPNHASIQWMEGFRASNDDGSASDHCDQIEKLDIFSFWLCLACV